MPLAKEIAAELRKFADAIDKSPDTEVSRPILAFYPSEREFRALAAILPRPARKSYTEQEFKIEHPLSSEAPVWWYAQASRSVACERVVVGKRIIPAQPEHEEDIVEWRCGKPVLSSGNAELKSGVTVEMEAEPLALAGGLDDIPF